MVTGAARGIGAAICQRLLSEGADVIAVDKLELSAEEPSGAIGKVARLTLDISQLESVKALVEFVVARKLTIEFLVNNAGIGGGTSISDISDEQWDSFLLVNLTSVLRMCRALVPHLRKPGGRIVNVSSVFGLVGFPGNLGYSVSKAGVAQLTKQIAVDLAPQGILVNAIAPGVIETEMTRRRIAEDGWYKVVMCEATPLGRIGRPEDIAGVVAFLCSEDSGFMTGQVLVVDGGWLNSRYLPGRI